MCAENHVIVRSYRSDDRPAVREIACDTADRGEPIDRLFDDRRAAADVLTRYYTDWEPQSLSVVDHDGKVVGYLAGCLDTHHSERVLMWRIAPHAVADAVRRGMLWHRKTWRLIAALGATFLLRGIPRIDLDKYPAHLHINIREGFRGRRVGRRLVVRFLRQVETAGIEGVHLVARGDNESGRRFFESMGFRLLREQPLVLPDKKGYKRVSTLVYGWTKES